MKALRSLNFWAKWGLIPRLMAAVGFASIVGGGIQNYLIVLEAAAEHSARHKAEVNETLRFLAPLVADQAILGDYAAIQQLLDSQVKKIEILQFQWTDRTGRKLVAWDESEKPHSPGWFTTLVAIDHVDERLDIRSGGASYGTLYAEMNSAPAGNRLWSQFVNQFQIVFAVLLLTLQAIWLIFRGNLGTLRMLAVSANRFSVGDHTVRVTCDGAPEVRAAAEAFNDMADNIESLITSLGASESNNRRLAAIVKQSNEAIWTRDLAGRITTWNAGAALLFGYADVEAIGRVLDLDRSGGQGQEAGRYARPGADETLLYEMRATTRSGLEIDIEVSAAPLHDEHHNIVGKITVAHDVTQRKRAEAELSAAREAAEAANRAKSSFLAKMSHEIRTPMNGVLGMTELLLETELTGPQRRFAETVQRSGRSLLAIINDILDFSKIEAGKLDLEHIDFDLRQTVEDAIELLAERAQSKGVELACNLPVNLDPRMKGDPLRIGQVLTNLVGNAIKFTEKGEVCVCLSIRDEIDGMIAVRFEVIDSGLGISQEAQGRIFENFSQADGSTTRKHGGTGLGLAISKQLVEMMGGEIRVKSALGAGSTFWFEVRFEKAISDAAEDPSLRRPLEGVRTLVVAHNSTTRSALTAQISGWAMNVRACDAIEEALQSLHDAAARGVPYKVIIVDSAVSDSGAIELVRRIKADASISDAHVFMLMPVGRQGHTDEACRAGVLLCLSKPVRQSALFDALLTAVVGGGADAVKAVPLNTGRGGLNRTHRGTLLLAEDNAVNQQVALGILKKEGFEVTLAKNGAEAVEACARGSFDIILMDCHMPELDGLEATRLIRSREQKFAVKRVPIIALTANAMQQDRNDCLNAGMDDHLSKPYTRLQMRAVLDRWLTCEHSEAVTA